MGGNFHWQPRFRAISGDIATVVLCRARALRWSCELDEPTAVVALRDGTPTRRWVSVARRIHKEWRIDAIASLLDVDQDKAAAIAADLGISFHSPETVESVHDKPTMRARLRRAGLEDVPCQQVNSFVEVEEFFDRVGPPIVLKPSRGRSSAGISVVRSRDQLNEAYHNTLVAEAPLLEPSPALAERYVEGQEFSVEAITHNGRHHVIAITEKFNDDVTKVELGHVVPARIDTVAEAAILVHVRAALTALDVRSGLSHTEVILGADGPFVVETHLRLGGDEIVHLVQDATGVDLVDLFLRQIGGQDIEALPGLRQWSERPRYRASGAIRYLAPRSSGTLQRIDGWDEVAALSGVRDAKQLLPPGTSQRGLRGSHSRLGYVRVKARDSEDAIALARRGIGKLTLECEAMACSR